MEIPESIIDLLFAVTDTLYEKIKVKFLGNTQKNKPLIVSYAPKGTLGDMFHSASRAEGVQPNNERVSRLARVAGTYLDAAKERTKARLVHELSAALDEAHNDPELSPDEVLSNALDKVIKKATNEIKPIIESETNRAKHVSTMDAVQTIGEKHKIEDPTIVFIRIRDTFCCDDCKKIHSMPDEVTPRAWKLSQVGSGYAPKKPTHPYTAGLHPNCRCTPINVLPNMGFKDGKLSFIALGYDLYEEQNS